MTRYEAFMTILETGSFTRAASVMGYTQSAVSQMLHSLEKELGTTLILRSRGGISLTPDGEVLLPYIRGICTARRELLEKRQEMSGLKGARIRIGTFSSVSSNWLPGLMKDFRHQYPSVSFELHQGEYTSIAQWIREGTVDFGFENPRAEAVAGLETIPLRRDEMMAVLPAGHPLAASACVAAADLVREPFILLDEGQLSEPLEYFARLGLAPHVQYRAHDDYTIMSMIENGLGIAILPKLVMTRHAYRVETRVVDPPLFRTIALAFRNRKAMPIASRLFLDFIVDRYGAMREQVDGPAEPMRERADGSAGPVREQDDAASDRAPERAAASSR